MTPEQQAAFVHAQAACAMAELAAMQCANIIALTNGQQPPHLPQDFRDLEGRFVIGHNAVISFFVR